MRSWVFFNGLFYKTLGWSLAVSAVAKAIINRTIEPVTPGSSLREIEGQIFPFPPGRFAITHYEHWHDGWPDYSEGIVGWSSLKLGPLTEKLVSYDNGELLVLFGILLIIVLLMSFASIGKPPATVTPIYIAMGLIVAAGVSNQAEVALFGHATDFLFARPSSTSRHIVVANLADVMFVLGIILLFLAPGYRAIYDGFKKFEESEKTADTTNSCQ